MHLHLPQRGRLRGPMSHDALKFDSHSGSCLLNQRAFPCYTTDGL